MADAEGTIHIRITSDNGYGWAHLHVADTMVPVPESTAAVIRAALDQSPTIAEHLGKADSQQRLLDRLPPMDDLGGPEPLDDEQWAELERRLGMGE